MKNRISVVKYAFAIAFSIVLILFYIYLIQSQRISETSGGIRLLGAIGLLLISMAKSPFFPPHVTKVLMWAVWSCIALLVAIVAWLAFVFFVLKPH